MGDMKVSQDSQGSQVELNHLEGKSSKGLGHAFKLQKGPDLSSKVPKKTLGDKVQAFKHQVSQDYEIGGLKYAIQLILSRIFPFVRPPILFKKSATTEITKLFVEVSLELGKLNKDKSLKEEELEEKVEAQVDRLVNHVKNGSSLQKEPSSYLEFVESMLNVESGTKENPLVKRYSHLQNKLQTSIQALEKERDETIEKVLNVASEAWKDHFNNLKQYPLDQDPVVVFNFLRKLQTEIQKLEEQHPQDSPYVKSKKAKILGEIQSLQKMIKGEISDRLETTKSKLTEKLPIQELENLAKEANISFSGQTFAEKIHELPQLIQSETLKLNEKQIKNNLHVEKLEKTIRGLEDDIENKSKKLGELETQNLAQEAKDLETRAKEQDKILKTFQAEIDKVDTKLKPLQLKKTYLEQLRDGEITGFMGGTKKFTNKNQEELSKIETEIKNLEQEKKPFEEGKETTIRDIQQLKIELLELSETKLEAEKTSLTAKIKELKINLEQEEGALTAAKATRQQIESKLTQLVKTPAQLNEHIERLPQDPDLLSDIEQFIRLSHLKSELDKPQLPTQMTSLSSEERDQLQNELNSIFGTIPIQLQSAIENYFGTVAVRQVGSAKDLGLEEFL